MTARTILAWTCDILACLAIFVALFGALIVIGMLEDPEPLKMEITE